KGYEKSGNMSLDILRYFKHKFTLDGMDPELFEIVFEFCQSEEMEGLGFVKVSAVAKKAQRFEWNNRKFVVNEGDKYYLWHSLKFTIEFVKNIGARHGLELRDT